MLKRRQKSSRCSILCFIIMACVAAGLLFLPGSAQPVPALAAQSTSDTLPTPTSAPQPTLTPTDAPKVWVGRQVSNTLGYTTGDGSIFRVKVEGMLGAKIELSSGNVLITGEAGSKPEYGSYTAEFAPVTAGTWTVSVPVLGSARPLWPTITTWP